MEAIDVLKNLSTIYLIIISSLCYCYFMYSKLPKGIFRLVSFTPIFCIFTILPFHLCSAYAIFFISFSITWICNFKLLLFAFDQGPISWKSAKLSLPSFITIAALPIKTKENKNPPKEKKFPLNVAIEALFFILLNEIFIKYRGILSLPLLIILDSMFTLFLIDIFFFCSCWIGKTITGLELDKPSNKPYLSSSVQEFWGRRWNLATSNILHHTIYLPVRTASEKFVGKGLCSTCVGVLVAFVVSGLMHELLYYHMTLAPTSWEVTLFFVIHGIVVSVEIVFKKRFKDKLRLPKFVSCPLTVGFLCITSWMLHFTPFIRSGVDVRLLEEYQICVKYLKTKILNLSSISGLNLS